MTSVYNNVESTRGTPDDETKVSFSNLRALLVVSDYTRGTRIKRSHRLSLTATCHHPILHHSYECSSSVSETDSLSDSFSVERIQLAIILTVTFHPLDAILLVQRAPVRAQPLQHLDNPRRVAFLGGARRFVRLCPPQRESSYHSLSSSVVRSFSFVP